MRPAPWLAPLGPVYGAAVRIKSAAYAAGLLPGRRLKMPVISVGNLSTGGSGKTPFVIALTNFLQAEGIAPDVLSRGYGRLGDAVARVPTDAIPDAENYGDEPLLIARETGVPVFVGRLRWQAGVLAEQESAAIVHLLDDGFQHRQLARDLDIVLLHRSDFSERLLPAGHLREPLTALRRAEIVVLRDEDRDLEDAARKFMREGAQLWHMRRVLRCPLVKTPVIAFCGIARPEEFFAGLRAQGVDLADAIMFRDHHGYEYSDLELLRSRAAALRVRAFVTTAKDAVRFSNAWREQLEESAPVVVAPLVVELEEREQVLRTVRQLLLNQ